MATGRILVWKEDRSRSGRFFGFIADDAFGHGPVPRDASVFFTERDVVVDPRSLCRQTKVYFQYKTLTPRDRNPEAANVRMVPLPIETGTVDAIRPYTDGRNGFFAFIQPDGSGDDLYFNSLMLFDPNADVSVGSRVRFRRDIFDGKPRARNVEVIE